MGSSTPRIGGKRGNTAAQKRSTQWTIVACVVLLLVGLAMTVPRQIVRGEGAHFVAMEERRDTQVHSLKLSLSDTVNRTRYAVVIDCGSSGSRLHAYSFSSGRGGIDVIDELFLPIKPGLGKFAGRPVEGASSLQPLIDAARNYVPEAEHTTTRLVIGATAGLRVLPGTQADELLEAVRELARATEFVITPEVDVFVMSGSDEGAFAWLAINFLLKRIGGVSAAPKKPVSVMDLGGGSVQMVRALGTGVQPKGAKGHRVATGHGKSDSVFVHSFLGLGLLASRMSVLEAPGAEACIPLGAEAEFSFHGRTVAYGGPDGTSPDAVTCSKLVRAAFHKHHFGCDSAPGPGGDGEVGSGCFFPGQAHPGASLTDEYYLMSFFNDRVRHAKAARLVNGEWKSSPKEMRIAAELHCADAVTEPGDEDDNFRCMDMLFMSELLTAGFKLAPAQEVTVFENQKRGDKTFEGSWCLGAALQLVLQPVTGA